MAPELLENLTLWAGGVLNRPASGCLTVVEFCIHAANVLYLASFVGRDMLWLRALTCAGLVFGLVFFTCQPHPMYGPAAWHLAFLFINGFQIIALVKERRALALTEEQERIGAAALEHLSRDELLNLLTRAVQAKPGTLRDIEGACHRPLTPEEQALRDIAFRRLSYRELVNLAVRRLWGVLRVANPMWWRNRSTSVVAAQGQPPAESTSRPVPDTAVPQISA